MTVYSYLLCHGGIKPRQRSHRSGCLSLDERETFSRKLASCKSLRRITRNLVGLPRRYQKKLPVMVGLKNTEHIMPRKLFSSGRPKSALLSQDEELKRLVTKLLGADWSPEQIAGWLKRHSSDGKRCVYRMKRSTSLCSFKLVAYAPRAEEALAHQGSMGSDPLLSHKTAKKGLNILC